MRPIAAKLLRWGVALLICATPAVYAQHPPTQEAPQEFAQQRFAQSDYAAIESSYESLKRQATRSDRGLPLSDTAIDFDLLIECGDQVTGADAACWTQFERRISGWSQQFPASALPRLALARAQVRKAMWAQETKERSQEADKFFVEAQKIYDSIPADRRDPIYFTQRIESAIEQGWKADRFDELIAEATAKYPINANIYRRAANFYLPSRGGQPSGLDALVRTAAKSGDPTLYAQIYDEVTMGDYGMREDAFGKTSLDWNKLRAGLQQIYFKQPSQWNLNRFAQDACLAGDVATLKSLIAEIGATTKELPGRGWSRGDLDRCRELAAK